MFGNRGAILRAAALVLLALLLSLGTSDQQVEAFGAKMFVAVMEDSPDAVLLDEPDRWAEPVLTLKFNEQVDKLSYKDEDDKPYFKIKVRGKKGYVKKNVLSTESQFQGGKGDAKAHVAVGAQAANTAAKGLNFQNEKTLRKSDKNFDARVKEVEAMERLVNKLMTGRETSPKPQKALKKYKQFGMQGGLIKEAK